MNDVNHFPIIPQEVVERRREYAGLQISKILNLGLHCFIDVSYNAIYTCVVQWIELTEPRIVRRKGILGWLGFKKKVYGYAKRLNPAIKFDECAITLTDVPAYFADEYIKKIEEATRFKMMRRSAPVLGSFITREDGEDPFPTVELAFSIGLKHIK